MLDVFTRFLYLGFISFGGPAAHIGYFHKEFVINRKWLTEDQYANLVALSHLLPGPGSSQVCFAIGHSRAGLIGAITAFIAFTLPSFGLMLLFAGVTQLVSDNPLLDNAIYGLKLLAVIVVADAVWGMFLNFCKSKVTQAICLLTAVVILLSNAIFMQLAAIIIAGAVGYFLLKGKPEANANKGKITINWFALVMFFGLFTLSFVPLSNTLMTLFTDYYQAGSLVFGGGHVVLPLLESLTSESVSSDTFLTGYALAQGIPGPMFTFATFLGYSSLQDMPVLGATIATLAIFLPGFLLVLSFQSGWRVFSENSRFKGVSSGINAAVVGLLISAFYAPVFSSVVLSANDLALVLVGFFAFKVLKLSIVQLIMLILIVSSVVSFL